MIGEKLFIVLVYVDDLIQVGDTDEDVVAFQKELDKFFPLKHLGRAHFVLGIELVWNDDGSLLLRQSAYIHDVASRFGVLNAKQPRLPAEPNEHLSMGDGVKLSVADHAVFRSLVGSLLYASVGTRPDISSALRAVSCFLSSPTSVHLNAAMRILKYLKGTAERGIKYSPLGNKKLISYADADFANDPDQRRSVSGGVTFLAGGAITWVSVFQSLIAQSSCEAEYVSLSLQTQQCLYLMQLAKSLRLKTDTSQLVIYEDNQSTIKLAKDWVYRKRTKHIDVKYHLVRHHVIGGSISLVYCPSELMVADTLTKPLAEHMFKLMRETLLGTRLLDIK